MGIIGGHVRPQDLPNWRLASSRTLHAARTSQHSLRWTLFDDDELLAVRVLASYAHVRVLVVHGTAAAVQTFVPALGSLAGLHSLDLRWNCLSGRLSDEGVAALAPSIQALTGLSTLYLNHNSLDAEGAAALAPSIGALTGLSSLDLSYNSIGDAGAAALAPSIRALTGLSSFKLSYNWSGADNWFGR
jgi:hypothetical protein